MKTMAKILMILNRYKQCLSCRITQPLRLLTLIISLFASEICAQPPDVPLFTVPPISPAVTADPLSLQINPAGLGANINPGMMFLHTTSENTLKGDQALFIATRGLGFGVEWLGRDLPISGNRYHLGLGGKLAANLFFGGNYSWIRARTTPYHKYFTWNFGALYRPNKFLSIATVAQNWNQKKIANVRLPRQYTASVAFRPLGDQLTIASDMLLKQGQSLKEAIFRGYAEIEPVDGIIFQGSVARGNNWGIGIRLNFSHLFLGSFQRFQNNQGYKGATSYVGVSAERQRTLVRRKKSYLEMEISGLLPEERLSRLLFRPPSENFYDKVARITAAKGDPTIKALILRVGSFQVGFARLQELRSAIFDFKKSGKPVVCYLDLPGGREYYLATAADQIIIPPVSELMLVGLKAEVTFYKSMLNKLGIEADLEKIGEYKTAADLLTRTSMSNPHREVVNALLDDYYYQFTTAIAEGRNLTLEQTKKAIDHGPYTSINAHKAGLVDTFLYWDELKTYLEAKLKHPLHRLPETRYKLKKDYTAGWGINPQIAVITATGAIVDGESGRDFLFGKTMGDRTISRAIKAARENNRIKAIVFRIDSPGGSGTASDVIWRELILTKKKKPVIISMSDVAASGGYYIACPGDKIFASPGTITGSIGVISGKLNLGGLYQKVGWDKEVVTRGAQADILGSTRGFNDEERAYIKEINTEFYKNFIQIVAQGRNTTADYIDSIGKGRVWTGNQARSRKLVDEFGGILEAIKEAKKLAGIASAQVVDLIFLPKPRWISLWRDNLLGMVAKNSLPDLSVKNLSNVEHQFDGQPLLLVPYWIEIR